MKEARMRVLLVDDHELIRWSLRNILDDEPGVDIVGEAADGVEAVMLTRRLLPELVVMDASMPRMNGIEASRAILSEFPWIKIIGLSLDDELSEAMYTAGVTDQLSKFDLPDNLLSALRAYHMVQRFPSLSESGGLRAGSAA